MIYLTRLEELMSLCFIAVEVYKGRSDVSKELWRNRNVSLVSANIK